MKEISPVLRKTRLLRRGKYGAILVVCVCLSGSVYAGTGSAWSGKTTVDTRDLAVGTIIGRVLGNSLPLTNVSIRVQDTSCATNTVGDGTFCLSGIQVGQLYIVTVSSPDYRPARFQNISVTSLTNNLGDITLTNAARPYQVIPLVPDVNPTISEVEEGGIAYRYYRVVDAIKQPVGNVEIGLRIAGGATVVQTGDLSDAWVGREAGISDADGLLRLRIPSTSLGSVGSTKTLEVLESGITNQSFQAKVMARNYDQVWKHKVGGGIEGKLAGLTLGVSTAYETKVKRSLTGGEASTEFITRKRIGELSAGVEAGGGIKIIAGANVDAGGGAYCAAELASTYSFDPDVVGSDENGLKLYVALGDPLSLGLGPAKGFYDYVSSHVEPTYLDSRLRKAGGSIRLGIKGNADATVGLISGKTATVGATAELGAELEGIFGYERSYGNDSEYAYILGFAAEGKGSEYIGAAFGRNVEAGFSMFASGSAAFECRLFKRDGASHFHRAEIEQEMSLDYGMGVSLAGWKKYESGVDVNTMRQYTETLSFNLNDQSALDRLTACAPIWSGIANAGQGSVIQVSQPAAILSSVLQVAAGDASGLNYEKTSYVAYSADPSIDVDLDAVAAGLEIEIEGSLERGTEAVNERGRIWQFKRMPLESYPALATNLFPNQSILALEKSWLENSQGLLAVAWNIVQRFVIFASPAVITNGNASLTIYQGSMATGSVVNISAIYVVPDQGAVSNSVYLPPSGSSNWTYGIGGIYKFESTNALTGTGTLTIAYADAQVTGLAESNLLIYCKSAGTDEWHVVGGTVDVSSNRVSCTVTQLGTYAIAPPLPTGDLTFNLSTNLLPADGVSVMTATCSNLMLNTGAAATQQWLYSVSAMGVTILNADLNTNMPAVQVASSNGVLTLSLKAPTDGNLASLDVWSVAGDASGNIGIPMEDNGAPPTPSNVVVTAGQSRIWASWNTNNASDAAFYRVYYRMGQNGPPYDGEAAVEGLASPVQVTGTNAVLRGFRLGTNYFVAVAAVDSAGNESALSASIQVTTTEQPPKEPTACAMSFGADGTNTVMWALSEDDGYNDRDVIRYDIYRAVMPGGTLAKVGESSAGKGLYIEPAISVQATQYVTYAVVSIDTNSLASSQKPADHILPDGNVDNDNDGMGDAWELANGLNPSNPADAAGDADGDGLSNLQEYQHGTNPNSSDSDSDGLPDKWEVDNGLDPASSTGANGRTGDADGDGADNWTEYISSTKANDPNSVLKIIGLTPNSNGFRIDWQGGEWATQYVQIRQDLSSTVEVWSSIFTNSSLPTPITNFTIDAGATNRTLYYRIKVER